MKVFEVGDYYTIVAKDEKEALQHYVETFEDDEELGAVEIPDTDSRHMLFPVEDLPQEYHDVKKYPRKDWFGEYEGVEISLREAMKYKKEKPPYILSVSSEIL